jgi:hypothetical protein
VRACRRSAAMIMIVPRSPGVRCGDQSVKQARKQRSATGSTTCRRGGPQISQASRLPPAPAAYRARCSAGKPRGPRHHRQAEQRPQECEPGRPSLGITEPSPPEDRRTHQEWSAGRSCQRIHAGGEPFGWRDRGRGPQRSLAIERDPFQSSKLLKQGASPGAASAAARTCSVMVVSSAQRKTAACSNRVGRVA